MCNISLFSPFSLVYEMINKMKCDNQKNHFQNFIFIIDSGGAATHDYSQNKQKTYCFVRLPQGEKRESMIFYFFYLDRQ